MIYTDLVFLITLLQMDCLIAVSHDILDRSHIIISHTDDAFALLGFAAG
jgi:hypothetical protein